MIEIKNLTKYYGSGESRFKALDGVSLRIDDGTFDVILGASGSGKSTFLNVISGLETMDGGSVAYDGRPLETMSERELTRFRRDNTAYIFQQYYLLPHLNVEKNVRLGADLGNNRSFLPLLDAVGLSGKRKKYPFNKKMDDPPKAVYAGPEYFARRSGRAQEDDVLDVYAGPEYYEREPDPSPQRSAAH